MRSPRSERKRSFSARYGLADADSGSESTSEIEEESKVRQRCFGKVALILLAQNKMLFSAKEMQSILNYGETFV